jgi:hypothetical protein
MDNKDYEYEVAISFLAQDEALATSINDLISERFATFIYSRRQEKLAGTDGEETFNAVFAEQSRIVVILYRKGWGETPFTRIEETAIKNRAYNDGYDYTIWVPLDDPPSVPKYVPKTYLWLSLQRFGVEGLAAVVDSKVQSAGGSSGEETAVERAARLRRAQSFAQERELFRTRPEGQKAAQAELQNIFSLIKESIETINGESGFHLQFKEKDIYEAVVVGGLGLSLRWHFTWNNRLQDARLEVKVWDRHPPFPNIMQVERPQVLVSRDFEFDLSTSRTLVWRGKFRPNREYDAEQIADFCLKLLFDAQHKRVGNAV